MTNVKERREKIDPRKNKERAWKIAIRPAEYGKSARKKLMSRGDDNSESIDQILSDAAHLIADVLDQKTLREIVDDPPEYIDQPGRLVFNMSIASILVRQHDDIQNDSRKPIIHKKIREHYMKQLFAARHHSENSDIIRQELGAAVYSRGDEDKYGPPAGNVIEGITKLPHSEGFYYKIPLTHANRMCETRENGDDNGKLLSHIEGPFVYVPEDDVTQKYEQYFTGRGSVGYKLEEVMKKSLDKNTIKELHEALSGMNKRISELIDSGNTGLIFKERRYPPKLEAILRSVEAVDEDIAQLHTQLTAEDIYNATREYINFADQDEWVVSVLEKIESPRSTATILSKYAADDKVSEVKATKRKGKKDLYELEYKIGGSKKIDVSEIEDLLELPCMENLHESLKQSKPVRWELYSFVRYLFEINEVEFDVEDIKEWFSQYDWYREDVTEYQVTYERGQVMASGDRPLPISCSNDNRNWGEHCIGRENCEYSLYRSVELKPDVYERTGED